MQSFYKENCVSFNCQQIYIQKEHALLGISPFNSYFSEKNILDLIHWTIKNFQSFNIFIPDTLPIYTFLALGYEESKAIKKTKRQIAYLRNKIFRALAEAGFSIKEAEKLIIDISSLEQNKSYMNLRNNCYELYHSDLDFQFECNQCTSWVLSGYNVNLNELKDKYIAIRYLLDEIPLFVNSPAILNINTSMFIYHQTPAFINYLYNHSACDIVSKNQGFIHVSSNTDPEVITNDQFKHE